MSRLKNIAATGNLGPIGGTGSGCVVKSITVNKSGTSATFTIYDGQSASGTVMGVIDAGSARQIIFPGGAWFKNGFFGVLGTANADINVEYE